MRKWRDALYRHFRPKCPPLAHSRTGRNRHDHGRRAPPLLRREQPAHPRLHQTGRQSRPRRRASPSTPRTPDCPPSAAPSPKITSACTASRSIRPREIVVTASGVQALNLGIRCVLDPGDEALVLTPAWPNGPSSIMMANAIVRQVPHPLRRWPLHRGFRRPRSRRHARAPACCCTPRPPIPWAGSPPPKSSRDCSISPAATTSG